MSSPIRHQLFREALFAYYWDWEVEIRHLERWIDAHQDVLEERVSDLFRGGAE